MYNSRILSVYKPLPPNMINPQKEIHTYGETIRWLQRKKNTPVQTTLTVNLSLNIPKCLTPKDLWVTTQRHGVPLGWFPHQNPLLSNQINPVENDPPLTSSWPHPHRNITLRKTNGTQDLTPDVNSQRCGFWFHNRWFQLCDYPGISEGDMRKAGTNPL